MNALNAMKPKKIIKDLQSVHTNISIIKTK